MTEDEFKFMFLKGHPVKDPTGKIIGRGLFESDMFELGFDKSELRKLVKSNILLKLTTTYNKSWRKTYVLRFTSQE